MGAQKSHHFARGDAFRPFAHGPKALERFTKAFGAETGLSPNGEHWARPDDTLNMLWAERFGRQHSVGAI